GVRPADALAGDGAGRMATGSARRLAVALGDRAPTCGGECLCCSSALGWEALTGATCGSGIRCTNGAGALALWRPGGGTSEPAVLALAGFGGAELTVIAARV